MGFVDISHQVFGKYQFCTKYGEYWYADEDFEGGNGIGRPKQGAIPDPRQHRGAPAFGSKRHISGWWTFVFAAWLVLVFLIGERVGEWISR